MCEEIPRSPKLNSVPPVLRRVGGDGGVLRLERHCRRRDRPLVPLPGPDPVHLLHVEHEHLPVADFARMAAPTMARTVTSTNESDTPMSSRTFSCSSIFTVVPRRSPPGRSRHRAPERGTR